MTIYELKLHGISPLYLLLRPNRALPLRSRRLITQVGLANRTDKHHHIAVSVHSLYNVPNVKTVPRCGAVGRRAVLRAVPRERKTSLYSFGLGDELPRPSTPSTGREKPRVDGCPRLLPSSR